MIFLEDRNDIEQAMALFNRSVLDKEILYKPFKAVEEFEDFFINSADGYITRISILSQDRQGFASGCFVKGSSPDNIGKAYITAIIVDKKARRRGIASRLLEELENSLIELSDGALQRLEISFFNPMNFSWIIPNTADHDHPNAPGVDMASDAYIFFKNMGYRDTAYQNSYHVDLASYEFPAAIIKKIDQLKQNDIEVTFYDKAKHTGMEQLFDNLGNELWRKEIMENLQKGNDAAPVLVVSVGGRVMGFTGPLSIQPSGRGYFCGIGVHSDCRGNGAGRVLFAYLCRSLKDMGARFMTLFTGETNPARNIYEAAGFKIVKSWADMEKNIK